MQIRALRDHRGWSQSELARLSGVAQPAISRCERVGYGKQTISTLLRLAEAFDVGLDVSFVPFGELWRRERRLASEILAPPSFSEERSTAERRASPSNVIDIGSRQPLAIDNTQRKPEALVYSTQESLFAELEEVTSAKYNERRHA